MMTNLFSIFDPHTSSNMALNWFSLLLFLALIPFSFFLMKSSSLLPFSKIFHSLSLEYKSLIPFNYQGSIMFFLSTFFFIMVMNTLGLFPFIFTPSSHIMITLSLSLVLWTSIVLVNLLMKTNYMLAHLVPQSSPFFLSFFMVIIETISLMIRPITLSVRLSANMIAGHLILSLISNTANMSPEKFIPSMIIQSIMILLETAVALIQAFVFSTLILLYSSE